MNMLSLRRGGEEMKKSPMCQEKGDKQLWKTMKCLK